MKKTLICCGMALLTFAVSCSKDDVDDVKDKEPQKTYIDGKEYVDLGLSVKWAACNIGAESPEDMGHVYIIGKPAPGVEALQYTPGSSSLPDSEWGNKWRMPTQEEIEELIAECIFEEIFINNKRVGKLTASNGNYILLPFNSYFKETKPTAYYETSTLLDREYYYASIFLYIEGNKIGTGYTELRNLNYDWESEYSSSLLIRPVSNY